MWPEECAAKLRKLASDCMSSDLRNTRPKTMLDVLQRVRAIKDELIPEENNIPVSLKGEFKGDISTKSCLKCFEKILEEKGLALCTSHFLCIGCFHKALLPQLVNVDTLKSRDMRLMCPTCLEDDVTSPHVLDTNSIAKYPTVFDELEKVSYRNKS